MRSANVTGTPPTALYTPTAVHATIVVQETASNIGLGERSAELTGGSTGFDSVHLVPFHFSARLAGTGRAQGPEGQMNVAADEPIAVHPPDETHEMELRPLTTTYRAVGPLGFAGLAVRWTDQPEPFQRSDSGRKARDPTAIHAAALVHETPPRIPPPDVWSIDHLLPSKCSISGPPLLANPTAMHSDGDTHETPDSEEFSAPWGAVIPCTDHPERSRRSTSGT